MLLLLLTELHFYYFLSKLCCALLFTRDLFRLVVDFVLVFDVDYVESGVLTESLLSLIAITVCVLINVGLSDITDVYYFFFSIVFFIFVLVIWLYFCYYIFVFWTHYINLCVNYCYGLSFTHSYSFLLLLIIVFIFVKRVLTC